VATSDRAILVNH